MARRASMIGDLAASLAAAAGSGFGRGDRERRGAASSSEEAAEIKRVRGRIAVAVRGSGRKSRLRPAKISRDDTFASAMGRESTVGIDDAAALVYAPGGCEIYEDAPR